MLQDNKQIRFKYTTDTIYIGVSHSYTKQGGTLVSNVLTSNNTLFQPITHSGSTM